MKMPHRSSLLATLPLISLVALPWAVCASPARGWSKEHPLSSGDAPSVMITGLGCDSTVVGSIVDPSQLDFDSILRGRILTDRGGKDLRELQPGLRCAASRFARLDHRQRSLSLRGDRR